MSYRQRIAICIGLFLEAALLTYPPWKIDGPDIFAEGHSFVWRFGLADLHVVPLTLECLVVAVITLIVVLLLGAKKTK